jgi:hypothetical protein
MAYVNRGSEYRLYPLENLESVPTLGYNATAEITEVSNVTGEVFPERRESGLLQAASLRRRGLRWLGRRTLDLDFVTAERFGHGDLASEVLGEDLELTHNVVIPRIKGDPSLRLGIYFNRHDNVRNERQLTVYMEGDVESDRALAIAKVAICCTGLILADRYKGPKGDIEVVLERYRDNEPSEYRTFTSDELRALPH